MTGSTLLKWWNRLQSVPFGPWIFSKAVGRFAPYTGTIGALVVDLKPPRCRVQMRDRKCVRNHLRSVHAIALCNLAEVTSGLAVVTSLPDDLRGILKGFSIEYFKKARGTLEGRASLHLPNLETFRKNAGEWKVEVTIHDLSGDCVARAEARWHIGPSK